MRRAIGNTLTAGMMAAALVPAGCAAGQPPAPEATQSFACNFERPDQQTINGETKAIRGLALAIELRHARLGKAYYEDMDKPQPETGTQVPIKGGGMVVLSYHAPSRSPNGSHHDAAAALADRVTATEFRDSNYQDPRYSIVFNQLCDGGWVGTWQSDEGSIATNANYGVEKGAYDSVSPSSGTEKQLAVSVVAQLIAQTQKLIQVEPNTVAPTLVAPKLS